MSLKYFIAIPTYNGGNVWEKCINALCDEIDSNVKVQVIDSSSKDNTVELAQQAGFDTKVIESKDFNHGGTRNLAWEMQNENYDVVIFLTQDAIPQKECINNIIKVFEDPLVACAYGKQIGHDDANNIAIHARKFNYSNESYIADKTSVKDMGLKTVFMSNSFSAYRIQCLKSLGGFPSNTILCEDMYFTAKAVSSGLKVAYVSNAIVKHSHNYTPIEEFKRYFDIGVFHTDEPWIRETYGGAQGEGKKFIISELLYLYKNNLILIPKAMVNNVCKIIGYKLGQNYKILPKWLVKKLSMHKRFWS